MTSIAVIDLSVPALFLYDVPEHFNYEQIEEFILNKKHKLSECSWGVFEGEINDFRN